MATPPALLGRTRAWLACRRASDRRGCDRRHSRRFAARQCSPAAAPQRDRRCAPARSCTPPPAAPRPGRSSRASTQKRAYLMRPRPGSSSGAVVSSTKSLVERSSSSRSSRHPGSDLCRGVANRESQGRPIDRDALPRQDLGLAVKRAVVGIFRDDDMGNQPLAQQCALDQPRRRLCTTASWQVRPAYFGRPRDDHPYCPTDQVRGLKAHGRTFSRGERSSPITCVAPPPHGQAVSSGVMTISTRGRWSGSRPRPARRLSARAFRSLGSAFSGSASPWATACSRSSSARLNCRDRAFPSAGRTVCAAADGSGGIADRSARRADRAHRSTRPAAPRTTASPRHYRRPFELGPFQPLPDQHQPRPRHRPAASPVGSLQAPLNGSCRSADCTVAANPSAPQRKSKTTTYVQGVRNSAPRLRAAGAVVKSAGLRLT